MTKSSKVIPLFVLLVFITALVGIFVSNLETKPGIMDEDFLNLIMDRNIKLKDIIPKNDFTILVFFRAQAFENKSPLDNLLKLKSLNLKADYGIVMLGIDGDYNSYREFLMKNAKYFLSFTWLYTNNTNYFRYVEESGELNIYVFWIEDGNLKFEYLGANLTANEIRDGLERLGFIG